MVAHIAVKSLVSQILRFFQILFGGIESSSSSRESADAPRGLADTSCENADTRLPITETGTEKCQDGPNSKGSNPPKQQSASKKQNITTVLMSEGVKGNATQEKLSRRVLPLSAG